MLFFKVKLFLLYNFFAKIMICLAYKRFEHVYTSYTYAVSCKDKINILKIIIVNIKLL
jgi:hypothetical protein